MFLRQSTASQEILLGRFVDSTDGNTEETGLTIANTDIKIFKSGATTLADKNSGGATHISNGLYYAVLDATDTDTIGNLEVHVHVAGALSVRNVYTVLDEAVYDALFGTTALATATNITAGTITTVTNVTTVNGLAANVITAAATAADFTTEIQTGLATAAALATVDTVVDSILVDTTAMKGATFDTSTDSLEAIRNRGDSAWITATGFSTLDAAGVRTAVGLASANLDTQLAGIPDAVHDEVVDGSYTFRQSTRLQNSAMAAKLSGAATTTVTIRDVGDTKDRIVATVDADGNRTALTLDAT
jgi:hypothetical protein